MKARLIVAFACCAAAACGSGVDLSPLEHALEEKPDPRTEHISSALGTTLSATWGFAYEGVGSGAAVASAIRVYLNSARVYQQAAAAIDAYETANNGGPAPRPANTGDVVCTPAEQATILESFDRVGDGIARTMKKLGVTPSTGKRPTNCTEASEAKRPSRLEKYRDDCVSASVEVTIIEVTNVARRVKGPGTYAESWGQVVKCVGDSAPPGDGGTSTDAGAGACKGGLGVACAKMADCCRLDPNGTDPLTPNNYQPLCYRSRCCKGETVGCAANGDCCSGSCRNGYCDACVSPRRACAGNACDVETACP